MGQTKTLKYFFTTWFPSFEVVLIRLMLFLVVCNLTVESCSLLNDQVNGREHVTTAPPCDN